MTRVYLPQETSIFEEKAVKEKRRVFSKILRAE
jgi:ABC-type lipopolysaccharide export system ATPase subunit